MNIRETSQASLNPYLCVVAIENVLLARLESVSWFQSCQIDDAHCHP
jgi:hypothetical protein